MPEISRFYGMIITMYVEVGGKHHLPHFHATYQQWRAAFSIEHIEVLGGTFRKNSNDWLKPGRKFTRINFCKHGLGCKMDIRSTESHQSDNER